MSDKRRQIEDVTLVKLREYSAQLARKIQDSGYKPEHILYVERAGLFIASEIAKNFACSISGINASRSGASYKSRLRIILRYLPKVMTDILRRLEEQSNYHDVNKERNVYIEKSSPPLGKKLLIVDDAIDTGYSLIAVMDHLISIGYQKEQINTAVLTITKEEPEYRADFFLFAQKSFAFPWSYTSKQYNQAWELFKTYKALTLN
jgi:hypoxanthine phosphoribosyltransferase